MKNKKKATRRLPANDIDLGKNTLLPDIDNVQVHSKSEKQKECHTLPGNYECGERNSMMMCETFGPVFSHTGTESSMAIPGGCTMGGVQIMDTPALDMQRPCYTPAASSLDKEKRKICDVYNDRQLLCPEDLLTIDGGCKPVMRGCTMGGVQIMDTPALDMQRPCYTPAASSLDKGKRKICDVYNDRQLLCPEDLLTIDGGCKPVMPDDPLHHAQCIMTLQGNDNSSNASHNTSSIILPSNDLNMCNTTDHRHTQAAANASVLGNHLRSAGQSTQHAHARGSGESINVKDRCQQCKGKKVTQEKKVLKVHVEKGMQHGQKITFEGQAHEAVTMKDDPDAYTVVTGDGASVLDGHDDVATLWSAWNLRYLFLLFEWIRKNAMLVYVMVAAGIA
ncbi:chaperone DnaJ [Artemisia annua]|uniref:Chaperone DnaJ n=1 Tax=Artemisia annua TaxID=35608 RepID=A0A2U1KHX1_ARTAN|nr:chaperone DnaJ [Artemisia annua]